MPTQPSLPSGPGVLPDSLLHAAVEHGWIAAAGGVPAKNIQPASVDLRLGPVAYRLRSSFLPGRTVAASLADYRLGPPISLVGGAVLERGRPYLIPLQESLALPRHIRAKSNPKSSTGRLDVFARLVVDNQASFDQISAGYKGPLYLELTSSTFAIHVAQGLSLNQVRLTQGQAKLTTEELQAAHRDSPLLYPGLLPNRKSAVIKIEDNGLFLTVDLKTEGKIRRGPKRIVGYKAKKNSMLLDLCRENAHTIEDFWEPVQSERLGRIILEPEDFYLLVSTEGVSIPPHLAGEMTAYDPTSGELRTHYAGFFDPGFGYASDGTPGSRAVLEVRAHDVPFALEHGQRIARIEFERMLAAPQRPYGPAIGSSYQNQRLKLSKYFKDSAFEPGSSAQPGLLG